MRPIDKSVLKFYDLINQSCSEKKSSYDEIEPFFAIFVDQSNCNFKIVFSSANEKTPKLQKLLKVSNKLAD